MALKTVTLEDKYLIKDEKVFLTGTQALVRLPLSQKKRDEKNNLNTACFISGYRGSPLGGVDQALWQAKKFLEANHVNFQPGVNEDLAATAVWGSQQAQLFGDQKYDGVYAMWYAKGPGIDRSGDVLRHGNLAGTSKNGGVLLLAGDDHGSKSSTTAHQCEFTFMDLGIPVLNPAGVQEILDLGLHGWALSRYSGCWVGFKVISETIECSASVYADPFRIDIKIPTDFSIPKHIDPHIHLYADPHVTRVALNQEMTLHQYRLPAALAYCRANNLNYPIFSSTKNRLGIITCGKSYLDVRQAFDDLGISNEEIKSLGINIYKIGMTWPLEPQGIQAFAENCEEILIIEEKRPLIENQIKEQLYNWPNFKRPKILGKYDENQKPLLPAIGELNPSIIAEVIGSRIKGFSPAIQDKIDRRIQFIQSKESSLSHIKTSLKRMPYFCSGCPHNTSTKVPEDSRAYAGIGCHIMAQWMDRENVTFTHMGGEGVNWIGQAPFIKTDHVFQNLGDGTYFHSGILAIRATVAAGVNITFKILYNDAVAMTGGQHVDGPLDVPMIVNQLKNENVKKIAIVSDNPGQYPSDTLSYPDVTIYHRDRLDEIQKEFRKIPGTSVIIYDQTCAAEKRRRRKKGIMPEPDKRLFINEMVCEGCGDCGVQSNCLSLVPVETEFGRKRNIDQSTCNKDYSCVKGFCPSFVNVHGGKLKKHQKQNLPFNVLPEPTLPNLNVPYSIIVTGVGGTGVITIGALLGMAAHLENKGCSMLDMTGLSQKGGAVFSHIRLADKPEKIHAARITTGGANLLIGCDIVVAGTPDALSKVHKGITHAVINTNQTMTGEFTKNPDLAFPAKELETTISDAIGYTRVEFLKATELATLLFGDSIATNLFMVGYAYQKGLIPLSAEAINRAIELNKVSIDMNKQAFLWGRRAAFDLNLVTRLASQDLFKPQHQKVSTTLDEIITKRFDFLKSYQNNQYAERYLKVVEKVKKIEIEKFPTHQHLSTTVAKYYFKLLAYKDEYEVARLYSNPDFIKHLKNTFEGDFKIELNLAPPLLAKKDLTTGIPKKMVFGPWIFGLFKILSKMKFLRGSFLDIFGYTHERRQERALIKDYEQKIDSLLNQLNTHNYDLIVKILSLPEHIRGYGHVKERHIFETQEKEAVLLKQLEGTMQSNLKAVG
ncbi:MAG: indolepyruvate ferredoxin oxidoreductase family protein [Alphaproteobacteria bacterium]|nr:indolepyruvate ferredoxin oxidoreductase family protein [Alphaproteobacteria bacterium]